MREQLDLFAWADARPSNVIDVMPALIRKAAMEPANRLPRANGEGVVTQIRKTG